jgi:purine-binding chemotaxis protein CheW
VERIIRAVAITPLLKTPPPILGIVNVQGAVIPVVSLRSLCRLPSQALGVSDQFIIAHTMHRTIALVVDAVTEVVTCDERSIIAANEIVPGLDSVGAVAKLTGGITILHDLDQLLGRETDTLLGSVLETFLQEVEG